MESGEGARGEGVGEGEGEEERGWEAGMVQVSHEEVRERSRRSATGTSLM